MIVCKVELHLPMKSVCININIDESFVDDDRDHWTDEFIYHCVHDRM